MSSHERSEPRDAAKNGEDVNRLRLVVLRLARQIRSKSNADVTPSQLTVIATLARHGECTIGQIADYEHVRAPSVSKIVDALEAKGLVERRVDPDDRRRAPLMLSSDGQRLVAEVRGAGIGWLAPRWEQLGDEERDIVREAIPVLERLLVTER